MSDAKNNFTDFDAMFGNVADTPEPQPAPQPVPQPVQQVSPAPAHQPVVENVPQPAPAPQQVYTQPVMQPTVQNMVVTQPKAATQVAVADDFEIGFSSEMENALGEMGIQIGDIGDRVSRVPIERYKASTSKVDRISFLTKRVLPIKYHFIDNVGSIVCFHGKCCEVAGVPQVRYLFPIAVYQTDADGQVSGSRVELKILSAGEDLYKSIVTINKGTQQFGGIDHADMLVTCTDDQYQKISLTFAGAAVWRQYRQIAEFLRDRWTKDGANAYMAVARKVDEPTFAKLLHIDEDVPAASSYDATANQDLSKFFDD